MNDLTDWKACALPGRKPLPGRHLTVEVWDRDRHGNSLWNNLGGEDANRLIHHFGWPQMRSWQDLADILDGHNESGSFITCMFVSNQDGEPHGMASYMNMVPNHGVIETGAIAHGPHLQRSPAGTEGHYLMARQIFEDLGYRRYEWKLNNPNEASHGAARRLGFVFEGVFRQHMVMPYGNRDTAWYSMLDHEWPVAGEAMRQWLEPSNFSPDGNQNMRLEEIRQGLASAA